MCFAAVCAGVLVADSGTHAFGMHALATQVMAYMLELGCVFHSLFIGLSLGVTVEGRPEVSVCFIGLSLGVTVEGRPEVSMCFIGLPVGVTVEGRPEVSGILERVLYLAHRHGCMQAHCQGKGNR